VSVDGGDMFPPKDIKTRNLRQNIKKLLMLKMPQNLGKNTERGTSMYNDMPVM
jgi:hypothetical protein